MWTNTDYELAEIADALNLAKIRKGMREGGVSDIGCSNRRTQA